jgi:hypothetical protein
MYQKSITTLKLLKRLPHITANNVTVNDKVLVVTFYYYFYKNYVLLTQLDISSNILAPRQQT